MSLKENKYSKKSEPSINELPISKDSIKLSEQKLAVSNQKEKSNNTLNYKNINNFNQNKIFKGYNENINERLSLFSTFIKICSPDMWIQI